MSRGYMSQGVHVLGGECPGGKCPGGKCPGGICPWGKCPGGTCPGGLCPRTACGMCVKSGGYRYRPRDLRFTVRACGEGRGCHLCLCLVWGRRLLSSLQFV